MITLYDLPFNVPIKSASLNGWKARYSLNYKGLAYQSKGVDYPDIEPLFKELGIPPTDTKPDGSPLYTVPAIYDDATGAKVSDSLSIAEYLDKTYPTDKPNLFPSDTEVLQRAFVDAFMGALTPILPQIAARVPAVLSNPASQEYQKRTRAAIFGVKDLSELIPVGDEKRAASLKIMHILGKDSEEWKAISSWHGGRWGKIADDLSEYGEVV